MRFYLGDYAYDQLDTVNLYFFYAMDHLVDLAVCVSEDFFADPDRYIDVGGVRHIEYRRGVASLGDDDEADKFAILRSQYGTDARLPGKAHREQTYHAIFGSTLALSSGDNRFFRQRDALLAACVAFAAKETLARVTILEEERVRTTHADLKTYLNAYHGDSLKLMTRRILPVLTSTCYGILRTPSIARALCVAGAPSDSWPNEPDANGDRLVENMAQKFNYKGYAPLTREKAAMLQRVATRGCDAIAAILLLQDACNRQQLEELVIKCCIWQAALNDLASSQGNTFGTSINQSLLRIQRST